MSLREKDAEIMRMLTEEHKSLSDIARHLGVTRQAVHLYVTNAHPRYTREVRMALKPTTYGRCARCHHALTCTDAERYRVFPRLELLPVIPPMVATALDAWKRQREKERAPRTVYLECRNCGKEKTYLRSAYIYYRKRGLLETVEAKKDGTLTYLCRECLHGPLFRSYLLPRVHAALRGVRPLAKSLPLQCVYCGVTLDVREASLVHWKYVNRDRLLRVCHPCYMRHCQNGMAHPDGITVYLGGATYACGCTETGLVPSNAQCLTHERPIVSGEGYTGT